MAGSGTFSNRYDSEECHPQETGTNTHPDTTTYTNFSTKNACTTTNWFSSETGIYDSKHKPLHLPKTQFLDAVSFIFSHKHDGVLALIDSQSGFSLSYSKLHQMVKSMASGLNDFGISKSDVVLILLPNTIFFPVVFLGVLSIGAIATTMNPLSSLSEIKKQISTCNVTLVFTLCERMNEIQNLGLRVVMVPVYPDLDSSSSPKFSFFNELLSSNPNSAPNPAIDQQDIAAILYSSGTSGLSKGVVLSHRNLISVVELFVRFEAFQYENSFPSSKNVYLASIPMFHVYGLSLFGMGLLSLGSAIVLMRKFDPNELVRAIDCYKVTHLPVVPPILMALTRVKALGGCDLGSLKQVSCGAAPISNKTIQDFLRTFPHVDFIQGYGMTESSAVGTRGFNTENIRKYTSVGLLAPNTQAKVVNWDTGLCLPPGRSGELWLRGPGIMKGYLNDADATKSTVDKDGWLHTGDIAHFDQDGYLHILDRLKDTIKYKGFQISPADLEAVLISHPEILDVAVTACLDDEAGEVPVAFVVKRVGSELSQVDVINFVAGQVSPYKKVRKVVFMHSIPRSPAGKILRRQLRNSLISKI
ncbi:AMP-dependent synthetase/ligase [Macleaya cordata]|uniref:4-coumarate--CoA ligase n=1 Tax=Macleaya cordata TaxID=56857 RepID=A0A200QNM6_MACCD|nr:AMP-dependent synthetase/ligase [Macleaya cordata]